MSEEQTGYLLALGIAILAFLAGTVIVRVYDRVAIRFRKRRMKREFRREFKKFRNEILSITGDEQSDSDKRNSLLWEFKEIFRDFLEYKAKSCLTKKEYDEFKRNSLGLLKRYYSGLFCREHAIRYCKDFEHFKWLKIKPIAS